MKLILLNIRNDIITKALNLSFESRSLQKSGIRRNKNASKYVPIRNITNYLLVQWCIHNQ